MKTPYKALTIMSTLGVVGGFGYTVSEAIRSDITDIPGSARVVEIDSELRDLSRVLDYLPVRVLIENPDSMQSYVTMSQREERLQEERDSLFTLPAAQQARTEKDIHARNSLLGVVGSALFSILGAFNGMKWEARNRIEKYRTSQRA